MAFKINGWNCQQIMIAGLIASSEVSGRSLWAAGSIQLLVTQPRR